MDSLGNAFNSKAEQRSNALIIFVPVGYPTPSDTVPILLAMERGGANIIELGVPFSDPIADGPTIQETNAVALRNRIDYPQILGMIKEARSQGLTAPILLMGYYNPMIAFGEDNFIKDTHDAGANGFIMVDLPLEGAVSFRDKCRKLDMTYVTLIAPSASLDRIRLLSSTADTFLYVVSNMGTTGLSASIAVNDELPFKIVRVKEYASAPLAVGFGVATHAHFSTVLDAGAERVVVGSRLVGMIRESSLNLIARDVKASCRELTCKNEAPRLCSRPVANGVTAKVLTPATIVLDKQDPLAQDFTVLPSRFGQFGGRYVPESLMDALMELEFAHKAAMADSEFWKEYRSHYGYINRPSQLYLAEKLTEHAGGANIWLKREDLNHTGSHHINNAIGQILLAKRAGKTRIVAETGSGQHGIATATACAKFGMECVIYMGVEDVRRQALNVFHIRMLGGKVIPVQSGSCTLKDAISEALRDCVTNLSSTHYLIGSAIGPHPYPTIVRDFQRVIGQEIKVQMQERKGKLPDAVIACVGGGSNAIGAFFDFIGDKNVKLVGVEAGGEGVEGDRHCATLSKGAPGVFHGARTYLLQSPSGQILETHSVSAGMNYPGVGPEHAWLKDSGRAKYVYATDEEALRGLKMLKKTEGIIPALESSHAIWEAVRLAGTLPKDSDIVVCLSGRGDNNLDEISSILPKWADRLDWHVDP